MFRTALGLAKRCLLKSSNQPFLSAAPQPVRQFSAIIQQFTAVTRPKLFQNTSLLWRASQQLTEKQPSLQVQQSRSVTKYSIQSGKRKSVKAVLRTFYRLQWGAWIRAEPGKHKRLWRKKPSTKKRLQQFVFVSAHRGTMLDKMVCPFWRRPKYWVDDPYEPYHEREEFHLSRKKPRPAHNPVEE